MHQLRLVDSKALLAADHRLFRQSFDSWKKNVLFTDPYCLAAQAIVVTAGSPIASKADLDGKTVSVQTGTTAEDFCMGEGYDVMGFAANSDAEAALVTGKVDAWVIDDLTAPLRLHQEDFAQALGIPASRKYERAGEDHMARMFDLLRRHSADPIRDMTRLWDQIVFNWLIGNTDAHVKNFSLLYSPDLRTLRLAPAYDLLAAAIYPTTRELSFRIGGAATLDAVTEASFEAAAREAGLGVRMAMQRYHQMVEAFVPALRAASEALQAEGFTEAAELAEQILRTGGIALTK